MKCSICNSEIEKQVDENGKVFWESGNNAEPINDGRCCDFCNMAVVIPTRMNDSLEVDSILTRNRQRTIAKGNN